MRPLVIALAALSLAACATTKTVTVPIPVTCVVKKVSKPVFAFDSLPEGSDLFTQVKTLLADRKQRIAYEREVEAAIAVCAQ